MPNFRSDFQDLTGKTFTYLTVDKLYKRASGRGTKMLWRCVCKCGNVVITNTSNLNYGHSKSCGCYQKYMASVCNKTHGMSRTRLCSIYRNMIERCYNKKTPNYRIYGKRGIKVCGLWLKSPENFFHWAKTNGYKSNLSIERKNNNGNYTPKNCMWADRVTQCNNTRRNIYLILKGEKLSATQAGRKYNISESTIRWRLKNGFSPEQAVNILPHPKARSHLLKTSPRHYIPLSDYTAP